MMTLEELKEETFASHNQNYRSGYCPSLMDEHYQTYASTSSSSKRQQVLDRHRGEPCAYFDKQEKMCEVMLQCTQRLRGANQVVDSYKDF